MQTTAKLYRVTTTGRTLCCVGRISRSAPITRDVSATVRLTLLPTGAREQTITFRPRRATHVVASSTAPFGGNAA